MVKSLILIGYMGCGKSALGKSIAANKSLPFIDLDDYIESQENTTISKIFEKEGELYLSQNITQGIGRKIVRRKKSSSHDCPSR
jgi:shikimate kinase